MATDSSATSPRSGHIGEPEPIAPHSHLHTGQAAAADDRSMDLPPEHERVSRPEPSLVGCSVNSKVVAGGPASLANRCLQKPILVLRLT